MEKRVIRQRCAYPTAKQKKKLIELMVKHPQLVSSKITQEFTSKDAQHLWQIVANQCNALPGAKKTWRQWKKTWQDIRSKTRKRHILRGDIPPSKTALSVAEQEALGLKNVSSTTNYQGSAEFVQFDESLDVEYVQDSFGNEIGCSASLSEPESGTEDKIFTGEESAPSEMIYTTSLHEAKEIKGSHSEHSPNCIFNCDMMAIQEQKKIKIKEDYYSFKKKYLRQKLFLMKEQTEALKGIAKGLEK